MPVLVDTSALYALADRRDVNHVAALRFAEDCNDVLVVPVSVLPEADYLVQRHLGVPAELAMLRSIDAGEFRFEEVNPADLTRAIELVAQYVDSSIGFVDASIVAVAERLRLTRIFTFDRRHFAMFRPRHCPAFELVP